MNAAYGDRDDNSSGDTTDLEDLAVFSCCGMVAYGEDGSSVSAVASDSLEEETSARFDVPVVPGVVQAERLQSPNSSAKIHARRVIPDLFHLDNVRAEGWDVS